MQQPVIETLHPNATPGSPTRTFQQTALAHPLTHILMGIGILGADFATGPYLMFPILFVIPVTLAAWFYNRPFALALAILLPAGRFILATVVEQSTPAAFAVANALIRVAVLCFIAYLVSRSARQTRELQREVSILEGILHICMFCKRIRDEGENWQQIENYIAQRSEADFSHGLCKECAQEHYGLGLAVRNKA